MGQADDAVIGTVNAVGAPSSRVMGLRAVDRRGLVFFVSHDSRKGRDLRDNPRVAATLYWPQRFQQINLTGTVQSLPAAASDELWVDRGLAGPAACLASAQGQPMEDEDRLRERTAAIIAAGNVPPRPAQHGGILVVPDSVEFWQGSPDRLHLRLHYGKTDQGWARWRLQP